MIYNTGSDYSVSNGNPDSNDPGDPYNTAGATADTAFKARRHQRSYHQPFGDLRIHEPHSMVW